MNKILSVTILVTSYNRKELLRKTITLINERTFFPFRIIVIDNASTDGSQGLLKEMKVYGKIWDYILMPENIGQCKALSKGFNVVEEWENNNGRMNRPSSDFIVTTQDDIYPPMLGQDNCWLKQMIELLEKNEQEYGGICMRIQRMPRTDIDGSKDIITGFKNFPSVFRLMRRSDLRKIEGNKFGNLKKWESNVTGENYKNIIRKKFGFTTYIYADHAGFMLENKGFPDGTDTFTVAANKLNERNEKPYPDIDPETNVPIKINHGCDKNEQDKRDEHKAKLSGEIKNPEITIIIPTYKRIDGLKRVIDSVKINTKDIPYEMLVAIDKDDTEAYNWCIERDINCILSSFHRDFVAQTNLAINACQTPYFVKIDDDMEVLDNNWLSSAFKIFKEKFPDDKGLMCFNDGIQHGSVFTTGISSKRFVSSIGGNLYHTGYKHFGGDREIVYLTKKLGCYNYEESINIKHHHWQSDDTVTEDETYKISKNKFWKQDQDLKKYRRENVDIIKEKNYE